MSDDDLTLARVNLTPRAVAAIGAAEGMTGMDRTDVVNRAVQVYAALVEMSKHQGIYKVDLDDFDPAGPLHVIVSREPFRGGRRWRPW